MTLTLISVPVALVLVWVLIEDLRRFTIRNLWVGVLALGFVLNCAGSDRIGLILPHAIFAAAGFVALACLFAMNAIGGGDAKLLGAALLWVGPEGCLVYALMLLPCTLVYVVGACFAGWPARRRGRHLEVPFGPSIAVSWLAFLAVSAWM